MRTKNDRVWATLTLGLGMILAAMMGCTDHSEVSELSGENQTVSSDPTTDGTTQRALTESELVELKQRMDQRFPISGAYLKSTSGHVFENPKVDLYHLGFPPKVAGRLPISYGFGQFVRFEDGTFNASNCTMCGNDVWIATSGKWRWVAENRIEIFVESIERNEYCNQASETPQRVIGVFELEWQDSEKTSLLLSRIKG